MIFFSLLILPRVLCIIRVKSTVIVRILMCKCKTSLCVYAHYNRIWWKGWFVIKTASQKIPRSNMSTRFFFSASNNNVSLRMTRTHVKYVNCFLTPYISNSKRKVNQLHLLQFSLCITFLISFGISYIHKSSVIGVLTSIGLKMFRKHIESGFTIGFEMKIDFQLFCICHDLVNNF